MSIICHLSISWYPDDLRNIIQQCAIVPGVLELRHCTRRRWGRSQRRQRRGWWRGTEPEQSQLIFKEKYVCLQNEEFLHKSRIYNIHCKPSLWLEWLLVWLIGAEWPFIRPPGSYLSIASDIAHRVIGSEYTLYNMMSAFILLTGKTRHDKGWIIHYCPDMLQSENSLSILREPIVFWIPLKLILPPFNF